MTQDIEIRCACGLLGGTLHDMAPARLNHVMCYCSYCQRWARWLGRAEELLDARGGTDLFQISPESVELTQGAEHLACARMTPKGPLRFYAACCKTPIANTLPNLNMPFVGTFPMLLQLEGTGRTLEEVLGPVRVRVNGDFSKSEASTMKARRWDLVKMLGSYAPKVLGWKLAGAHKRSPFRDADTGGPVCEPELLPKDAGSAPAP